MFVSQALITHRATGRHIGVASIFHSFGWRWMVCCRVGAQYLLSLFRHPFIFFPWLIIRFLSIVLSKCGLGTGDFASSVTMREYILRSFLRIISRQKNPEWRFFWQMYFLCAKDGTDFMEDYTAAWSIQQGFEKEVIMFVDNSRRLAVPCSKDAEDKALLEHLRMFYDLNRTGRGVFEVLGPKTSQRIDIVELQQNHAVGDRLGVPLKLGRHGSYSHQIYYFRDPSDVTGKSIRDRLVTEQVLTLSDQQINALNIVRGWDPHVASLVVLFPIALSLSISIIWSAVAVATFKADVQTSFQTGFTIGSYVVTAGALLIALVAFLDTKTNAS